MTQTTALPLTAFIELHDLLRDVDPARWRDEQAPALSERLARVRVQLADVRHRIADNPRFAALAGKLADVYHVLESHAAGLARSSAEPRRQWMAARTQLLARYEALVAGLAPFAIHVPSLRPTNYLRNLFHLSSATFSLALLVFVPWMWALRVLAIGFATWCWSMELVRRVKPELNAALTRFFSKVIHPHEYHRVNSSTWYATALAILTLIGDPVLASVAVVVLGVGDPAAALVGRRFGRIRLVHGRSLEGTLTFLAVATACVWPVLVFAWGFESQRGLLVALAGSGAGALAELFSRRVDDNLSVPLSAAAGAFAALAALG